MCLSGLWFFFWMLTVISVLGGVVPLHWLRTISQIQSCTCYQACDLFSECWQSSLFWGVCPFASIGWAPYFKFKAVLVIRPAICFLKVGSHLIFFSSSPFALAENYISNSEMCLLSGLWFVFWMLAVWVISVLDFFGNYFKHLTFSLDLCEQFCKPMQCSDHASKLARGHFPEFQCTKSQFCTMPI